MAVANRDFFASPNAWEDDSVLSDARRFSMVRKRATGQRRPCHHDGSTPPFQPADAGAAHRTEEDAPRGRKAADASSATPQGLASKSLPQAPRRTAIWVSPVFKQVAFKETYHGYGIQNFLDVDPRFGTREDLKDLVRTAHEHGLRIVLDIILNHTGDVFAYDPDRYPVPDGFDPRWDRGLYRVAGFRISTARRACRSSREPRCRSCSMPDGAVWPANSRIPPCSRRRAASTTGTTIPSSWRRLLRPQERHPRVTAPSTTTRRRRRSCI